MYFEFKYLMKIFFFAKKFLYKKIKNKFPKIINI